MSFAMIKIRLLTAVLLLASTNSFAAEPATPTGTSAPLAPAASPSVVTSTAVARGVTMTAVVDADGTIRMPSLRLDLRQRTIEAYGRVCIERGLLEVLCCTRAGKTHESLLILDCRPRDLMAALLALGLVEKPQVQNLGDGGALTGERVVISVAWGEGDKAVEMRAEDLVLDSKEGKAMPRDGFVFTGSRFIRVGPREVFMADASGQIVTTYHDPDAILDNPSPKGGDDTTYYANSKIMPPAGTPVRVIFRPEGTKGR